jgi:Ca2+/H+ antiporter
MNEVQGNLSLTSLQNAISFAMNGNIALSMEIGSAYVLQVCLLQVPALVLFSALHGRFISPTDTIDYTFSKSLSNLQSWFLLINISSHISPVGYGYGHSLRFPAELCLW